MVSDPHPGAQLHFLERPKYRAADVRVLLGQKSV